MKILNIFIIASSILFFYISILMAEDKEPLRINENVNDRLIRLEVKIDNLINNLNERFNQVDRRFQDVVTLISDNHNICGFDDWQHWAYLPGKVEYKEVPVPVNQSGEQSIDKNSFNQFISELRLRAKNDPAIAEILKKYNLL